MFVHAIEKPVRRRRREADREYSCHIFFSGTSPLSHGHFPARCQFLSVEEISLDRGLFSHHVALLSNLCVCVCLTG